MFHHKYSMLGSMLDSLMSNGRQNSNRMSWTKMAATGALVYFGSKMLFDMMNDND